MIEPIVWAIRFVYYFWASLLLLPVSLLGKWGRELWEYHATQLDLLE